MDKKLRRSTSDRVFAGVCGGIAEFFGIETLVVRLLFVIFGGALVYLILMIAIPEEIK
jgi:phage shock protein PspC (stress-responsive transcriptional regulator)